VSDVFQTSHRVCFNSTARHWTVHQHLHCSHRITGHTPLHLACRYGHIPVALALLVKGCELDATDNEGVCLTELNGKPMYM
jgi:ankyrin repeat protein